MIALADTTINPDTVVVEAADADVTHSTVFRSSRPHELAGGALLATTDSPSEARNT